MSIFHRVWFQYSNWLQVCVNPMFWLCSCSNLNAYENLIRHRYVLANPKHVFQERFTIVLQKKLGYSIDKITLFGLFGVT
jgi:hypothetical protein